MSILKKPSLSQEVRDRMIAFVQAGGRVAEAAEEFGVSRMTVYDICRGAGIRFQPRRLFTNRDVFLGVNISDSVDEALDTHVAQHGLNQAKFVNEILAEKLTGLGYHVEAERLITGDEKLAREIEKAERELEKLRQQTPAADDHPADRPMVLSGVQDDVDRNVESAVWGDDPR